MGRIKIAVALSLLFLISTFFLIENVYAFHDDFGSLNITFWGQSPTNTNNATISMVDGKNCLNMTTNNVANSISSVFTHNKFKDVSVTVKFKIVNYAYTGDEQTFFAFWFYSEEGGEFDVEIGFWRDIRNVKISTYCNNSWFVEYIDFPVYLNDSQWHVLKIDWNFVVNVTVDGRLVVKNWIMPNIPMNFWMGAFSHNGHVFSLYVDEVTINDESSNSKNWFNPISFILLFVPVLIVLFFVKIYT